MTKPEGPVQEPRIEPTCKCGHLERWHDTNGAVCEYRGCQCAKFRDVKAAESSPPIPATPAPSQPMSAVRMDEMGVDDVAIDATMFRFERMDERTFWLCAYRGDKRTTFTMWTQGGKLYCRKDDDELGTTDDSENPVTPERAPAPSQPAGAREWLKAHSVAASYADAIATTVSQIGEWMEAYARQQSAAKDAEIAQLKLELDEALLAVGPLVIKTVRAKRWQVQIQQVNAECWKLYWCGIFLTTRTNEKQALVLKDQIEAAMNGFQQPLKERAEAAERERDSLREANARLAADLDAALKAGKDGR